MIKTSDKYKQKILIIKNKKTQEIKMNNNSDNFMEVDVIEEPAEAVTSPSKKKTKSKNTSIIPEYYKTTQDYDELVDINKIIPNETNVKIYTEDELEDLVYLIEGCGLRKPIYCDKKTKDDEFKKAHGGHRRHKALDKLGCRVAPVKYVDVPEAKSTYDDAVNLMLDNVGRDLTGFQKYLHVNTLNSFYEDKIKDGLEHIPLDKNKKKEHCYIAGISYNLYDQCEKIKKADPTLYKSIEKGKKTISGAWTEFSKQAESDNRFMSPQTETIITREVVLRALSVSQNAMRQHYDIKVPDAVTGSEWNIMRDIQPNIISGTLHEVFTKSLSNILNSLGVTAFAFNDNKADLNIPDKTIQAESKCAKKKGVQMEWTGSRKVKGAYYNLLGFTEDYGRFFHCLVKVPYEAWKVCGGNIKVLSCATVYELIEKGDGVVYSGSIECSADGKVEVFCDKL